MAREPPQPAASGLSAAQRGRSPCQRPSNPLAAPGAGIESRWGVDRTNPHNYRPSSATAQLPHNRTSPHRFCCPALPADAHQRLANIGYASILPGMNTPLQATTGNAENTLFLGSNPSPTTTSSEEHERSGDFRDTCEANNAQLAANRLKSPFAIKLRRLRATIRREKITRNSGPE